MPKTKKKRPKRRKLFWSLFSFFIIAAGIAIFLYIQYIIDGLPSLEELENPKQSLASIVFSADGEEIGRFYRERRVETHIDSIPLHLIQGLISTEDKKFYQHWGVDLDRLVKALVKTFFLGQRQGASTLTMQLAKLIYGYKYYDESGFDIITRKIKEWITAIQLEKAYTKDEILEMYLNTAFFGRGAYGLEMATRIFFNKKVQELTIPESATLISLLKSHVLYDPVRRYIKAVNRRNLVMREMVEDGHLSQEEYNIFNELPIVLKLDQSTQKYRSSVGPYFVEYVRQQMEDLSENYEFNIYEDGLTIYTTLDTRMQKIANKAVKEHIESFQEQFDKKWNWRRHRNILDILVDKAIRERPEYLSVDSLEQKNEIYDRLKNNVAFVDSVQRVAQSIEVGFVVLDVTNGDILTMVGGRDIMRGTGLNHVTQITRQPGSAFKPIIYSIALDNGLYPSYPLLNQPFDYNGWQPTNFIEDEIGGFTTLREAITNSINLIAARLIIEGYVPLWQVGVYAQKMGIKSRLQLFPAISLGASEVSPLELTTAFATIANRGIYNEPISIIKIEDKDGILIDSFAPQSREAISEETAYILTNLLESVVNEGTGLRIRALHNFHRPAAGKTGTNTDYKDAWFVGFTPQLAGGVWIGFNDQRVTFTGAYGQGAKAAIPIWANFMREVYDSLDLPIEYFIVPDSRNVVSVNFCKESIYEFGNPRLASDDCRTGILSDLIFLRDIPPTFNAERDTSIKLFDKYSIIDENAHEAIEILE
ncbi:penicillin-binding protein 1A [Bacteroidota bacterium]